MIPELETEEPLELKEEEEKAVLEDELGFRKEQRLSVAPVD